MAGKILNKFANAFWGIYIAFRHDLSFQVQVVGGLALVSIVGYFFRPLSDIEFLFLGLSWALLLITEIQNSALEHALNRLHPEMHDAIGKSKDMAAGAVLLAGFFVLFVCGVIVFSRLFVQ